MEALCVRIKTSAAIKVLHTRPVTRLAKMVPQKSSSIEFLIFKLSPLNPGRFFQTPRRLPHSGQRKYVCEQYRNQARRRRSAILFGFLRCFTHRLHSPHSHAAVRSGLTSRPVISQSRFFIAFSPDR